MNVLKINDVDLMWHEDYYDGPIDGVLSYKNDLYYFGLIDEPNTIDCYRKFELIKMTEEEITKKVLNHRDFDFFVGGNSNYYKNERVEGIIFDREKWVGYYEDEERRALLKINKDSYKNKPSFILEY
jgi:hypothetical protein